MTFQNGLKMGVIDVTLQKQKPVKNQKYLNWIDQQPNVIDQGAGGDHHHIKRQGFGGGMKCDDIFSIPLSRQQHTEFHAIGWRSWENKYNIDQYEECCKLIQRYNREVGL